MADNDYKIVRCEIRYVPDSLFVDTLQKLVRGDEAYLPVDQMELVDRPGFKHNLRQPDDLRSLTKMFDYYQNRINSEDERVVQLRKRSMSIGDAIVIDGTSYYISSNGFVRLEADGTYSRIEK